MIRSSLVCKVGFLLLLGTSFANSQEYVVEVDDAASGADEYYSPTEEEAYYVPVQVIEEGNEKVRDPTAGDILCAFEHEVEGDLIVVDEGGEPIVYDKFNQELNMNGEEILEKCLNSNSAREGRNRKVNPRRQYLMQKRRQQERQENRKNRGQKLRIRDSRPKILVRGMKQLMKGVSTGADRRKMNRLIQLTKRFITVKNKGGRKG